ncbi:histidine kinase dimerization/phosphoacceptor domain -containing protein [Aureimonas sp. ME7]|uniref:sensor histidine kinase n=1 Tax=Aureimonas sp. ME7 TaxID=2744252 RepID=UPI0015F3FF64|nr:histidine kinase dimerization/phosphoacceptor domain -containing protein [Aureimonas sp. ME7]
MEIEHATRVPRRDELAYRLKQQKLLAEFGRRTFQAGDIISLLQGATELCARGLEAPYCKILEYRAETDDLLMRGGWGWGPGEVGVATLGADLESPAGFAFHTGEAVLSNHLEDETRFRTPKLLADYGVRRAVNVLIDRGGRKQKAYGVLEVDSPDPGDFDASDVDFLSGCARILGAAIERMESDRHLKEALETQGMLTREMNHRVKNSLGVVGGLLRVNANVVTDPKAKAALVDAEARIMTIARVHDHLWKGASVTEVDLSPFLDDLCSQLGFATAGLEIQCRADHVVVSADKAIPVGLIVNELVTNAVKYAYDEGEPGEIQVSLWKDGGKALVRVRDGGHGLPASFDLEASRKSFGIRVILSLVRQLEAELTIESVAKGASFLLSFDPITES